jgi:hypothetical protein
MKYLKNLDNEKLLELGKKWSLRIAILVSNVETYVTKEEADAYESIEQEVERRGLKMPEAW